MSSNTLISLKPGELGIIAALHAEEDLYHRLAALGFRAGKEVRLIRGARFAGPLQVRVGTTDVMLRRRDAQKIEIHRNF
jgi:ferrous iron transport protein A